MTAAVDNATTTREPRKPVANPLTTGQLPRFVEIFILIGAAIISGGIVLLMGKHWGTFVLLGLIIYLVALVVISTIAETRRKAVDRLVRSLVCIAFVLAMAPLVSTLATVVSKGIGELNWAFISQTGGAVFDPQTLKVTITNGAFQAVVGTVEITGIAALMSVPIGILTSIYLVEYARPNQWMPRAVTFLVDVMTGIPSIVAGLFALSFFTIVVGPKAFSGFSASVALSVLMIPIVVRSCEEMLRLVPHDLREASFALGVSRFSTIMKVVLPTAIAGIITGVMLAIARVIGETAPIFIAASFTTNLNWNPFSGPMQTLPVLAYTGYKFPSQDIAASNASAWGAALLLVIIVVILNIIARIVAKAFAPKGSR
jgi:phosphate transport system permease protein